MPFVNPLSLDAMTLTQAAALTGRNRKTVSRWIESGELAAGKIGGRWYTTESALVEFAKNCTPGRHDPANTYPTPDACRAILAAPPPMEEDDNGQP